MEKRKDIDDILKEAAERFEMPYSEEHWRQFKQMQEAELSPTKAYLKNIARILNKKYILILAGVCILSAGVMIFLYSQKEVTIAPSQQADENKTSREIVFSGTKGNDAAGPMPNANAENVETPESPASAQNASHPSASNDNAGLTSSTLSAHKHEKSGEAPQSHGKSADKVLKRTGSDEKPKQEITSIIKEKKIRQTGKIHSEKNADSERQNKDKNFAAENKARNPESSNTSSALKEKTIEKDRTVKADGASFSSAHKREDIKAGGSEMKEEPASPQQISAQPNEVSDHLPSMKRKDSLLVQNTTPAPTDLQPAKVLPDTIPGILKKDPSLAPTKNTFSFMIEIGAAAFPNLNAANISQGSDFSKDGYTFNGYAGLEGLYKFSARVSLFTHFIYQQRAGVNILFSSSRAAYEFGLTEQQYKLSIEKLHYMEIPLGVEFTLGSRHKLGTGLGLSYLLSTSGTLKDFTDIQPADQTGYSNGINTMNYYLLGAYAYQLPYQFRINIMFEYFLNSALDESLFKQMSGISNSNIKLGISYRIK